ncbi:MAG: Ig-like domain repeat protein [Acidobacteria bacterium]|nr:Ig-like domain repeat protein [Acidobacteriota bacterium]
MNTRFCLWIGILLGTLSPMAAQDLTVTGDGTINLCESRAYTLSLHNNTGNPLTHLVLSVNLSGLSGFAYLAGTTAVDVNGAPPFCTANPVVAGTTLTWDLDSVCGTVLTLDNGQTLNLSISLQTGCGAVSGSLAARADYLIAGTPSFEESSRAVQVLPGAVSIRKTPAVVSRAVGQDVTWTLTVENTGYGTIRNVVITDVLGAGLQYVSSSPAGANTGQTTNWGAAQVPQLASLSPGEIVTLDLTANVAACDDLDNTSDVRWGCDLVTDCFNTAVDGGTATAAVQRLVRTPSLAFTPPDITPNYCETSGPHPLTVTNTGDGAARNVELHVDFSPLTVASSSVPYNAGGYFELPDLAAGAHIDLTFTLESATWCAGMDLARTLLWMPHYHDACDAVFSAPVELSQIGSSTGAPGLTLTLSGAPDVVSIDAMVAYNVVSQFSGSLNCGSGSVGAVTVTDTVPTGFTVVDAGGGTWVPGPGGAGGTVTWTYTPPASLNTTLVLQSPPRTECETYCFTTFTNAVNADVTDCCGCTRSASASHTAAIVCDERVTSSKTAVPATAERCAEITYTNTYAFEAGAGVNLNALTFTETADHQQRYVPGSLSVLFDGSDVTSCVTLTDSTPGGPLTLDFSGCSATSVDAKVLVVTYRLTVTEATAAACGGATFYDWSALHMTGGGSQCLVDGTVYEVVPVSVEAPAMALSLTGLPLVMDKCRTQTVTLALTQASTNANPRDVRLVLSGLNYALVNPAAVTCSGNVSPTSCTPALVGNDYVWSFADGFNGAGQMSVLQFDVRKRCTGTGTLDAAAYFDDRCHDDATSDNTCAVTASASPAAIQGAALAVEIAPEVYYATASSVRWTVTVTNRGAGTAYNVWADHLLGAGLSYASAVVDDMTGVTVTPGFNHGGGVINGATVAVAAMAPGERREITFDALLVNTTNLTLDVGASWGCLALDCQAAVTGHASVEIPSPLLVNTAVVTTPVDACGQPGAMITLRNAGQATCYNAQVTDTLPAGLLYTPGTTRWRLNAGAWNGPNAAYDPNPTVSPLRWTSSEIPAMAVLNPGDTLEIESDLSATCAFAGGTVTVSTQYEDPGGQVSTNPGSVFPVAFHAPDLRVTKTRANDPVGCGETVSWTITAENRSGYTLPVVWVEDTMDAAYTYNASVGDPPYTGDSGTNVGQVTTWELVNLPHGATAVLTLVASTDASPCSPDLDNTVRAWWGCGAPDGSSATKPGVDPPDNLLCLAPAPVQFVRTETRQPALATLSVGLTPLSIDACNDGTEVRFTLANTGPTDATDLDLVFTLPPGLTYVAGSSESCVGTDDTCTAPPIGDPTLVGNQLRFYDIADKGNNLANVLQAAGGNDTLVLKFRLQSNCYATADLGYTVYCYDCCGDTQHQTSGSREITALYPALSVTQAPLDSQVACGTPQAWTLTVTNTGAGNAQVIRVEDTPGSWITVDPGASSPGLTALGGGAWGWEFNNLAPGASRVLTLAGTLNPAGNDCAAARRRNDVRAIWGCGTAGDAIDGDPTTTVDYVCIADTWAYAPTATLRLPNLAVGTVTPSVTCVSDGIFTGSLAVQVVNTGDGGTGSAFVIQASDGKGWTGTWTCPATLAAGQTLDLVIPGPAWSPAWVPGCTFCAPPSSYSFTVALDAGNAVCECNEGDNVSTGIWLKNENPVLSVTDLDFTNVTCAGDQLSGTILVRVDNTGCAIAVNAVVTLSSDCGLTFADQAVTVPAGSNAWATFPISGGSWTACAAGTCAFTAGVDPSGSICECAGGSHSLTEPLPPAYRLPDLAAVSVNANASCSADGSVSGTVSVTLANFSPVAVGSDFHVRVADGRGWSSEQLYSADLGGPLPLNPGDSHTVTFNWNRDFTATPYTCSFPGLTAEVDSSNAICECTGANNQATGSYNMTLPNLRVVSVTPSCASDGLLSVDVVVDNNGCGAASNIVVSLADNDGHTDTQTVASLAAGASQTLTFANWPADGSPATLDFTAVADSTSGICELSPDDNTGTASLGLPNLRLAAVTPACVADGNFRVRLQVENSGAAAVNSDFVIRLSDDDGHLLEMAFTGLGGTLPINAGTQQSVTFSGWPVDCSPATVNFTGVLDALNQVCESNGADNTGTGQLVVNDLDASGVVASTSCTADGVVTGTLAVTVTNRGGQAVNSDFHLRVDDGQGWTSELHYNADLGGILPLAPGSGATVTFNWTRNFTATPYVCAFPAITALVDSQSELCECTAANNQTTSSYTMNSPNLRVVSVTPSCASDGLLSIDVVIDNNGCGAASNVVVSLADNDGHTDTQTVASLAAGASQTLTFAGWPADGSPATLDFTAVADSTSGICELSPDDNTGTASYGPPNLRLVDLVGQCTADGLLRMALRIENTGAAPVTADFDVALSDDDGHARTAAFTTLGGALPLAAGAVQTLYFDNWPVDCDPANPQFTAVADPGNVLCEGSDTDNTLGPVPVALSLPNLIVTDIELGALHCDGGVVSGSASVTVRNAGTGPAGPFAVRLSTTAGLAFADQPVAALAAGDRTTLVFPASATLPDCTLCGADFTAEADPAGTVCECRGDDNTRTVRPTAADKLYWTDEAAGTLQRAEADGTSVETVLSGLAAPRAVTLDGTGAKAYWIEPAAGALRRANLDGTGPETLLTGLSAPVALAVDPAAGKLYWTDAVGVHHANTDGTGPVDVLLETGASGIALDTLAGRLYFTRSDGRIRSARLDGTDLQDVLASGLGGPFGLALDNRNGKLCFSDPVTGVIGRVNPDGAGLETLLAGLGPSVGYVALNPAAETLYYETRGGSIARVGFDGSGAASVVTGLGLSSGVAVLKLNTAPTATLTNQSHAYLQGAVSVPLDDIVVTDADFCERIAAVLTLADPSLGSLSTGSGHGETYDPASGRWVVTGPVADVNAALADVAFLPVPDNAVTETVAVRIRDASGAGPADGSLVLTVIPYPVISGAVRLDGAGVASVAMAGLPGTVTTNASGLYSAVLPHDWTGTVTPALAGYFFTPASRSYANVAVDQPNQDYAATALTTTVLASAPNPSVYGDTVTLTATLTSAFGPPPGTVRFLDGAVEIGTGPLSGGTATFTTTLLAGGSHTLTAVYDGAAGYQGSTSAPVTHVVNPAPTTTSLSSAPNPSIYGDAVTLTAVVGSGAGTPAGTVTFTEGAVVLGSSPLAGGTAVLVIPSPPGGPHVFTAAYSGSSDHQPSASAPLSHLVNPAPTATSLASAPNPSVYGGLVTLTAVVTSPTPTPAGTVAFYDGGMPLGTGTLDGSGATTLTTTAFTGGVHTLTAIYAGTPNHAPSASAPLAHTVNRAPTTTAVAAAPNPSVFGQPVTFTVTVTAVPGVPTGSVQFRSDGSDLAAPVPLTGATAALTVATLAAGSHVITAEYLPGADPNYAGSTGTLAGGQTVLRADTATALTPAPNPSRFGQPVTLTASVTVTAPGAGTPSGTVTFLNGATPIGAIAVGPGGTAAFTTASLPVGVNALTAHYEGDASFNPSVSPEAVQTVEKADTATTLASSRNPAETGDAVTFTVSVAAVAPGAGVPTGTVELRDGPELLQTLTLDHGSAAWTTDDLAPGRHPMTASYAGDGNFNASGSDTLVQEISRPVFCAHVASTDLWWTRIHLLNTGDRAGGATLEAFDAGGALLETVPVPALPPGGLFSADAASLFSAESLAHDLWVRVIPLATLRGLCEFGTRDGLAATALPIGPDAWPRLVFPYVYVSPAGSGSYYTGITLVNPGTENVQAVLEAFSEDGAPLGAVTVPIPARGKYVRLVGEAFPGVGDPGAIRFMRVAADGPLTGFELFGKWDDHGLAGLAAHFPDSPVPPLNGEDLLPYHLYYNEVPDNAAWYTGVTFVNLDAEPVTVTAEVFSAGGERIGAGYWGLNPMQQVTREIWAVLGAEYPAGSYLKASAVRRVLGFELFLSRGGPFRFDGLPAQEWPARTLVFPLVRTSGGNSTRLRLTNVSGLPVEVQVRAFAADGTERGAWPAALAAGAQLQVDAATLFPTVPDLAWIAVEASGGLIGDALLLSADQERMIAYPGLPAE